MVPIQKITHILGLDHLTQGDGLYSMTGLRKILEKGLPKESSLHVLSFLFEGVKESKNHINDLIPQADYNRRKKKLNFSESERVERLARVLATASFVWENDTISVRQFMLSPNALLNNETPYKVARSEIGARQVEDLLWSIYYGLPS